MNINFKKTKIRNKISFSKNLLHNEIFFKNYLSLKKSFKKINLDGYSFLLKRTKSFIPQIKNKNLEKNENILFKLENSFNEFDKNYFNKKQIYNSIKNENDNYLGYYKFIKSKSQENFFKSKKINLPENKFENLFKNNPLILKNKNDLDINILNENEKKSLIFLKKIEKFVNDKIEEINQSNQQILKEKNVENEKNNENFNNDYNFKEEIKDLKKNIKKNNFLLDKIKKNLFLFKSLVLSPSNSKNLNKTSSTFFSLNNTQNIKFSQFSLENKNNNKNKILIIDSKNNDSFNNKNNSFNIKKENIKIKIIKNQNSSILKKNNLTPSNKKIYKSNIEKNNNNNKILLNNNFFEENQNEKITNIIKNLNNNNINELYINLKDNPKINKDNFFLLKKYFYNNQINFHFNKKPFNLYKIINYNLKKINNLNINKISKNFLKFGKIPPKTQKLIEELNETNSELKDLSDNYINFIIDSQLKNK